MTHQWSWEQTKEHNSEIAILGGPMALTGPKTRGALAILILLIICSWIGCTQRSEFIKDESVGMNGGFEQSKSGLPVNWLIHGWCGSHPLNRESKAGFTAGPGGAARDGEGAAVGLGDLPAEHQADA